MTIYPYAGRNLLAEPESYEFAACEHSAFLESWYHARGEAVARLERRARMNAAGPTNTEPPVPAGAQSLRAVLELLLEYAAMPGHPKPAHTRIVDALHQKFEIFRRLYLFYDDGLRRCDGSPLASAHHYLLLAEILGTWADRTGKSKYLSTMLKAIDALCSLSSEEFSAFDAGRLVALIGLEERLVREWITVATK
jgi:hypothetical protein